MRKDDFEQCKLSQGADGRTDRRTQISLIQRMNMNDF